MDSDGSPPPASPAPEQSRWLSAWPDALAGAGGLALAWFLHWQVRDLVWSLWLSSLVVGYAMIVWRIFGPVVVARREMVAASTGSEMTLYWIGGLFLLAFFTVHFGMFHFVHSVFLNLFFPVFATHARGFTSAALYAEVVRDYWPFVLVAAVAERRAFQRPGEILVGVRSGSARGGADKSKALRDGMMDPYRNVVRMHCLIFFFAFAHFARLENFFVYAVVYAVYFFPWRLLRRPKPEAAGRT